MQFRSEYEIACELYNVAQRNEQISRRIQSARRFTFGLVGASLLLGVLALAQFQSGEYAFLLAALAFGAGYAVRSIVASIGRV